MAEEAAAMVAEVAEEVEKAVATVYPESLRRLACATDRILPSL